LANCRCQSRFSVQAGSWKTQHGTWHRHATAASSIASLQPLDRAVPMVSTDDVGRAAAALLQERWEGKRVVELEGPKDLY
jgi:NAD(P)H dehydrogenase (quinone)